MATCYYCGFSKRFNGKRVEKVVPITVPAYTEGYEYESRELAHPSCTREHE